MDLDQNFEFDADPSPSPPALAAVSALQPADLGLLAGLEGTWTGEGFNAIWRPNLLSSGQDRFLELNLTHEVLQFEGIPGSIPNRGLLQPDIHMGGVRYLQQISDRNLPAPNNGLHIEPGLWLNVPATSHPAVSASIARLASIPHGTTILAQGLASQASGGPTIPAVNLDPFSDKTPGPGTTPFPEQNLGTATNFRTGPPGITGITQAMVNNPNSILESAIHGQTILSTVTLHVSTNDLPVPGGGTDNTAFLQGGSGGPNADSTLVTATFWLETVEGSPNFRQLQYSQRVLLNFNGLSWPHVTVATLRQ
jgi:hypothetical protein